MSKIGKRAILLLLALPIGFNVMAQETKKPMLEELIPGGESYLYAENLYGLQWWGDECIKPGVDTLYSIQYKILDSVQMYMSLTHQVKQTSRSSDQNINTFTQMCIRDRYNPLFPLFQSEYRKNRRTSLLLKLQPQKGFFFSW